MRTVVRPVVRKAQRGIALLVVLGLVIFLSLIALPFSESQRLSTQMTANALMVAKLQAAADGAVHRMLFELARPRAADATVALTQWKANGMTRELSENGFQMTVSARNEAAKIDLNFAAEALLKSVFVNAGVSDEDAQSIVAAIKDWTDADNLKRPNGAEADDYRTAGKKTVPSNDFFIAIEELQNVMGVTPQIFSAVSPYLTVQSRSAGVDPLTAPSTVLSLVPGIDTALVQSWVSERDAALQEGLPVPPIPFSSAYFATGGSSVRIVAEARSTDGLRATREASVRLNLTPGSAPQFYLWQRAREASKTSMVAEPAAQTSPAAPR
jgi:general secretion pathway protein K